MFTVVDPGGLQSPYVPGLVRQKNVEKIAQTSATRKTGHQSSHQESPKDSASASRQMAGPSAFQARLYEQVESVMQSKPTKILAREIMSSPVVTLPITASLAQAWDVMRFKRFRHIPILGEDNSLIGMLSDRDLMRGTMEAGHSGTVWSNTQLEISIRDLVSHPVLAAVLDAELSAIARVLLEERIGSLPIISEIGELAGMITRSDILRVLVAHPHFEQWV